MKLVIDLVPNHLGVQHPWVLDPPAPDWFHGTLQHHRLHRARLLSACGSARFAAGVERHHQGWFTDAMPDLNQENPLVSRYLIQNALWWVEQPTSTAFAWIHFLMWTAPSGTIFMPRCTASIRI
jgi:glycosidase